MFTRIVEAHQAGKGKRALEHINDKVLPTSEKTRRDSWMRLSWHQTPTDLSKHSTGNQEDAGAVYIRSIPCHHTR